MSAKQDYGVDFVNIELRFKPELYLRKDQQMLKGEEVGDFIQKMAQNFYRFGAGWNEQSRSFSASFTYKGGKTTERPKTVTQHGKTVFSAVCKLFVIFELCGGFREGLDAAIENVDELEVYIEDAVAKLLG